MLLADKAAAYIKKSDFEELNNVIGRLGRNVQTRFTIIGMDGAVLADSEENPAQMENHKTRPEIFQAYKGDLMPVKRYSQTVKGYMLYVAVPIYDAGRIIGVSRASFFMEDVRGLVNDLGRNIVGITGILWLAIFFISVFISKKYLNPVSELSKASRRMADGDFSVKVLVDEKSEFRELADNFNYMVDRIGGLMRECSVQKEDLDNLMSPLQRGFVIINSEGRILTANQGFCGIVGLEARDVEGRFYWEIIRESGFGSLFKSVMEGDGSIDYEIQINEKFYLCSAAVSAQYKHIIVSFYDITEIKRVEKVKKDFVTNASHELRTPLTAIKGFIETLEEKVSKKNLRYIDIIKRHADRMKNIIEDLLLLSETEESGKNIVYENVDLARMADDMVSMFSQRASEKGVAVESAAEKDLPLIKADRYKLEQMFVNLLDNAVKYTERGKISVSISRRERSVLIKVADTGIGIPSEHIPRIFERFYVVDKSHSRKLGGTGLGLAIVKHIVNLHNGSITVSSVPGEGTSFVIELPL